MEARFSRLEEKAAESIERKSKRAVRAESIESVEHDKFVRMCNK